MDVIKRALEIAQDEKFQNGPAHPQAYDYACACEGYRGSYAKWVWQLAHQEARLERALENGKAMKTRFGLVHLSSVFEDLGASLHYGPNM